MATASQASAKLRLLLKERTQWPEVRIDSLTSSIHVPSPQLGSNCISARSTPCAPVPPETPTRRTPPLRSQLN